MRRRVPSLVFLLYVAIDLTNPFVPGAFGFTPEKGLEWVEAMSSHARPRLSAGKSEAIAPAPTPRVARTEGDCPRSREPVRAPGVTAWLAGIRTGDPRARDLPPSDADDH